jgi:hypothetical protein
MDPHSDFTLYFIENPILTMPIEKVTRKVSWMHVFGESTV